MPVLHLLAGPNGSGKSTYVRKVLGPATQLPFVNADVIAAARWPDEAANHAYEAAAVAADQRRAHLARGDSFITETVFSHPSKVELLADASAVGYLVHLHVVMVPVELAVQRVSERVRRGEHDVPPHKIRERFDRLWALVVQAVSIADTVEILDNSSARDPFSPCATFHRGSLVGQTSWPRWAPVDLTRWHSP